MTSLQYSGLGGKRNAGYGQFEYEMVNNQQLLKLLNQKENILFFYQRQWLKKKR